MRGRGLWRNRASHLSSHHFTWRTGERLLVPALPIEPPCLYTVKNHTMPVKVATIFPCQPEIAVGQLFGPLMYKRAADMQLPQTCSCMQTTGTRALDGHGFFYNQVSGPPCSPRNVRCVFRAYTGPSHGFCDGGLGRGFPSHASPLADGPGPRGI